jgi:hypothetical protein
MLFHKGSCQGILKSCQNHHLGGPGGVPSLVLSMLPKVFFSYIKNIDQREGTRLAEEKNKDEMKFTLVVA